MNLASLFRKRSTAPVARERLQVLLAHERGIIGNSDLIATLQEEILAVIARHVSVDREAVQIKLDRGSSVSMLEIDIEVPASAGGDKRASGPSVPASA
jgi:cell division topological specificity factor